MSDSGLVSHLLKVLLGIGRATILGFKTVDLDPGALPDFVMDIRDLKFAPGSVSVIYSSHIFEHFRPVDNKDYDNR